MKVTFNREKLLAAYSIASQAVSKQVNKPVLCNLKLSALDQQNVTLTGMDGENGIETKVEGVEIETPGVVLLNPEKFGQIIRSMLDETISASQDDTVVTIKGKRNKFEIPTSDPSEYPSIPEYDSSRYSELPSIFLKSMIDRASFCNSKVEVRYALGGLLFECLEDQVICVGSNGRCVSKMSYAATCVGKHITQGEGFIIAPLKGTEIISRAIQTGTARITCTPNVLFVRNETSLVFARLLEGKFVPWRKPTECDMPEGSFAVEIDTAELLNAARAAAIASDEDGSLLLSFSGDALTIHGKGTGGKTECVVQLPTSVPTMEVYFKDKFIIDCLRSLPGIEKVTLEISSPKTFARIKAIDGYVYVMNPAKAE